MVVTEYQNLPYGVDENAFFVYEDFDENRVLKKAFYPKRPEEVASGKQRYKMPKQQGEIRLVGVDLASSAAKNSDCAYAHSPHTLETRVCIYLNCWKALRELQTTT